jgi:hypothetical protein
MDHHEFLTGFVRLHIHHAAEGELYGQRMIEELARRRREKNARENRSQILSRHSSRTSGHEVGKREGSKAVRRDLIHATSFEN